MKIKNTLTTFSAIIALAVMVMSAFSQNSGLTVAAPDTATSFSQFSMPQNLGAAVNSVDNDQLPVVAPSGLSLYFQSTRAGGLGGSDIWVSQRATLSSAWGTAQNLGAILNTSGNEAPSNISPDGRKMFFNSSRTGDVDIWLSTRTDPNNDFGWTTPVNLGAPLNSATADQNGNCFVDPATGAGTLFFTSDRNLAPQVKDIYQSTRNVNGTFNAPTIVSELNSAGDEAKTAISRDGLEIFFSSNRFAANVGVMFVSTRASVSAAWNPPVQVPGLNTRSTGQPSLSPDGSILYFASSRTGGFGSTDVYSAVKVSVNRSSTADFDGDGRTDYAVFRNGIWYLRQSANGFAAVQFGLVNDQLVPAINAGNNRFIEETGNIADSETLSKKESEVILATKIWDGGGINPTGVWTINKSGGTLTLNNNLNISSGTSNLNLTDGTITTGTNIVIAGTRTVTRTNGFINGNLRRTFPAVFTVGGKNGTLPNADAAKSLTRNWSLSPNGVMTANLTFQYLETDVPITAVESDFKFLRYNGTISNEGITSINTATKIATLNGITSFSDWSLGQLAPTAASVTVSGRVTTADGRGIARLRVSITDFNGETRTTGTNSFGYYRFDEIRVGESYIIQPRSKRYRFAPQVFTITEDLEELNFTAEW